MESYGSETNLLDGFWIGEAPPPVHVRYANILASIATSSFRFQTSITWATIVLLFGVVHLVQVVSQLCTMWVGYLFTVLVKPDFHHIVRNISLKFATDIHNVQTEHCKAPVMGVIRMTLCNVGYTHDSMVPSGTSHSNWLSAFLLCSCPQQLMYRCSPFDNPEIQRQRKPGWLQQRELSLFIETGERLCLPTRDEPFHT